MFTYQQAFILYQLYARNRKSKRKTRNHSINWFNTYFFGILYDMPNLDDFNMDINKEILQDCSAPCKWAVAKLEPNKLLLMRGADRIIGKSKKEKFLW